MRLRQFKIIENKCGLPSYFARQISKILFANKNDSDWLKLIFTENKHKILLKPTKIFKGCSNRSSRFPTK